MPRLAAQNMPYSVGGFTGTTSGVDLTTRLIIPGAFTMSLWFRFSPPSKSAPSGYLFGDETTDIKLGFNSSYFISARVVSGGTFGASTHPATHGKWHFLVLRRNADNTVDMFRDDKAASRLYSGATQAGNSAIKYIGRTNVAQNFRGDFTKFHMWDGVALTDDEILTLYRTGVKPPGSTLSYEFTEGSGTVVADSVGTNTGTLVSGVWSTQTPLKLRTTAATRLVPIYRNRVDNLVKNGDFDYTPPFTAATTTNGRWIDGTAAGSTTNDVYKWHRSSGGAGSVKFDTTVKYSGGASLKLTNDIASYLEIRGDAKNYYEARGIPLLASTSYKLRFRMKTEYLSGDTANSSDGAYVAFLMSTGAGVAASIGTVVFDRVRTTTDWTLYESTFTTSADCRWGHVELRLYCHNGADTLMMNAWFDDIELAKTTPTTRTTA